MKLCDDCKYAKWKRTALGRLHPDRSGFCGYPYAVPSLPAAMYWHGVPPKPMGGSIERKVELKDDCRYWVRVGDTKNILVTTPGLSAFATFK